jgi:hypothetical protein
LLVKTARYRGKTILGLGDREQQEAVRGIWLFEIADLAGMSKADVDKTKAFVSRQVDRARPAYGCHRVEPLGRFTRLTPRFVQVPVKFQMMLNLKTAKALRLGPRSVAAVLT